MEELENHAISEGAPFLTPASVLPSQDPGDDDSSAAVSHPCYAVTVGFVACVAEWVILIFTCTVAVLFIPLTPAFTIVSSSASVLNNNITAGEGNIITAYLGVELLADDSNPTASSIYFDDSFHVSLFHGQEKLSTFTLPSSSSSQEPTKTFLVKAEFPNVSLVVDQWSTMDDRRSCGFVYLDLRITAHTRYTQPLSMGVREKLHAHCREVEFQLCFSSSSSSPASTTTTVVSSNVSCDVKSDVVSKIKLTIIFLLLLLQGFSMLIAFLILHFCFS